MCGRVMALMGVGVTAGLVGACGLITAPASVPAAIAENSNFTFNGTIVDQGGAPLDGVIVKLKKLHHFWTPIKGSADVPTDMLIRRDGAFNFDERGSFLELTFTKDGYLDSTARFDAETPATVTTQDGVWPNIKNFPMVMYSAKSADAALARFSTAISYDKYPVANCISLTNMATDGRSGDITFLGKDAQDPTVFPPGTLYLTLAKEAPTVINAKGEIDPADLDMPAFVTLHLPGPQNGFVRMELRVGYQPLRTSDQAPESGYGHELTIPRERLKAMRAADSSDLLGAYEYFYFRANDRYGKGVISWATREGKPSFRYELYLQPQAGLRDVTSRTLGR